LGAQSGTVDLVKRKRGFKETKKGFTGNLFGEHVLFYFLGEKLLVRKNYCTSDKRDVFKQKWRNNLRWLGLQHKNTRGERDDNQRAITKYWGGKGGYSKIMRGKR